jgi:uncharacterized alpha-E superfamily protein
VLSRIADSLFWLGRYIERAEYTARILDVNYQMLLEQSQQPYRLHWEPLIVMAGEQTRFAQSYQEANAQTVFEFLAFHPENPSSIVQCITKARENARMIRDQISREMWEDINGLFHDVLRFDRKQEIAVGPHRMCEMVKFGGHRFHGAADATLPHDAGWDFFRIGWALEREEMTARLVDVKYHNLLESPAHLAAPDSHQWMAVLKSVGAYETYQRQYHSPIDPEKVAEMLVLHQRHPRSILFSTTEVQAGLRSISGSNPGTYANEAERLTGKVLQRLRYDKVDEIFDLGLHQYLIDLLHMFNAIGDAIARTYFYYGAAA